jgi:hypothetical protein
MKNIGEGQNNADLLNRRKEKKGMSFGTLFDSRRDATIRSSITLTRWLWSLAASAATSIPDRTLFMSFPPAGTVKSRRRTKMRPKIRPKTLPNEPKKLPN